MTGDSMFPGYGLFRAAAGAGLRVTLLLNERTAVDDPRGWNFWEEH